MLSTSRDHLDRVLGRLRQVQRNLSIEPAAGADTRLADEVDSMGLVELVALLAEDCGVTPDAIEKAVQHRFGTPAELADALAAAGLTFRPGTVDESSRSALSAAPASFSAPSTNCWLGGVTLHLPETIQAARQLDEQLERPAGWLERHAGIRQRHLWDRADPVEGAASAGRACLEEAGLLVEEVGALLVTSEAPPMPAGLAAALHHRLGMRPQTVALEVGGACTGFLTALWLAQRLLPQLEAILILAVEAPSVHLAIGPGEAGENAALFGDGAAACVLGRQPLGRRALPLLDVGLSADGAGAALLRVEGTALAGVRVRMEGRRLASCAVDGMAGAVRALVGEHGLSLDTLAGVIVHGGNGRMAPLVARRLGLDADRVWSQTSATGNLGSVSLPAAWAGHKHEMSGPVAWAAVGAGLTAGWILTGATGAGADGSPFGLV